MSIVQKVNRLIGERPGVFLGTAATSGAGGTVSLIMSPLLISALISGLDLSEKSAGFIATSEFLTIAFVSFLIAPKMGVWPRRSTALCGALIAIVGHACSAFAVDVGSLTIARMVAGIGAGMMLAAGNAVVASANNPDKLYSILMIVTGAAHLLLLGLGPIFTTRWSYPGAYGIEVVFLLCLLPFVWLLPQHHDADASGALKAEDSHQPFPLGSAIMICLAMTIFFAFIPLRAVKECSSMPLHAVGKKLLALDNSGFCRAHRSTAFIGIGSELLGWLAGCFLARGRDGV